MTKYLNLISVTLKICLLNTLFLLCATEKYRTLKVSVPSLSYQIAFIIKNYSLISTEITHIWVYLFPDFSIIFFLILSFGKPHRVKVILSYLDVPDELSNWTRWSLNVSSNSFPSSSPVPFKTLNFLSFL